MKHLQTFENFTEEDKAQYDNLTSNKEELETSSAFEEMPEHEQEILSDAYNKESGDINSTHLEECVRLQKESIRLNDLRGEIGEELRKKGVEFEVNIKGDTMMLPVNTLNEKHHIMHCNHEYNEAYELLSKYFETASNERKATRNYIKKLDREE